MSFAMKQLWNVCGTTFCNVCTSNNGTNLQIDWKSESWQSPLTETTIWNPCCKSVYSIDVISISLLVHCLLQQYTYTNTYYLSTYFNQSLPLLLVKILATSQIMCNHFKFLWFNYIKKDDSNASIHNNNNLGTKTYRP